MSRNQGALALLGAWLVPLAAHAVGVDALLPLVILAALIMIQRGSATLLDRFVVALGLLVGTTCAAGLVISWWPWHLHPVLISGFALTVLVAIGWLRGVRRPRWGDRRDALVFAGWLGITALTAAPFVARDLSGRLGLVAPGEDLVRHFALFDAIGQVGGYAFMHIDEARRIMPDVGILTYPQGTHFLYALLGRFWGIGGDGVSAMNWLIWCLLGTFSFLVLAVLWAVRRIAGPGPSPFALLLVLLPVSAYVISGDLLAVLFRGFPNELLSLVLVALLVAVLARPLHRLGEQVALVVALVVGISFTYYLFLPFAGLVAAGWALWRWRALRRRLWLVVLAVVAAPLAVITPLSNPQANNGNILLTRGTALTVDRPLMVVLVAGAALALLARRGLRSPARRMTAACLAGVLAAVAVLATYQYAAVGQTMYYFEKLLHLMLVVAVVATGAAVRFMPSRWVPSRGVALATATCLAVCAVVVGFGGPSHTKPGSYGLKLVLGVDKGSPDAGRDAVYIGREFPEPSGPIVVSLKHTRYANYFGTMCGAALRRDFGGALAWLGQLWPPGPPATLANLEALVNASPRQVRLLVGDPDVHSLAGPAGPSNAEIARDLATKYPGKVLIG